MKHFPDHKMEPKERGRGERKKGKKEGRTEGRTRERKRKKTPP